MNIFGIGKVVDSVGKIADDLITTDEERLKLALRETELDVEQNLAQVKVNTVEAAHKSVFVAGWRPFIGWVGGIALAYQFILYPLLVWMWAILQAKNIIPCHVSPENVADAAQLIALNADQGTTIKTLDLTQCTFAPPPTFDATVLFTIVTGMLGIGGMRSYDKLKKTDTKLVGRARHG